MKKLSILVLLATSLVIWSCGGGGGSDQSTQSSSGNSTGVTDTEIKIGSFGPLTGPAALWGNIMKGTLPSPLQQRMVIYPLSKFWSL